MKRNRGAGRRNYAQRVEFEEKKKARLLKKEERIYGTWPAEIAVPSEEFDEIALDYGIVASDRQLYLLGEKMLYGVVCWFENIWEGLCKISPFLWWLIVIAIIGIITCVGALY